MARLTALNFEKHKTLRVAPNHAISYAIGRHLLQLRVGEVSKAIVNFPVFITRQDNGEFTLSAMTSFEVGRNLFIQSQNWDAVFRPALMQSYPFYLMQPEDGTKNPVLAIHEESQVFGDQGEALFNEAGKLTLWVNQIRAALMEDANNLVQSFMFIKKITELNLIRSIDIAVHYETGTIDRIRSLNTINEDMLHSMSSDQIAELRDSGYLAPIYAILFSIYQLNALIRRHNKNQDKLISRISLEVSKDPSLF